MFSMLQRPCKRPRQLSRALGGVLRPQHKWSWIVGAFALCFFAGGAIWWRGSYVDYLDSGFPWGTLLLLAGVALYLSWGIGAGVVASAIAIGSAFPAIIFVRVVLDGMEDPTNHNLWPFEIVMAFGIGMMVTFPFAAFGALLRRVTHRGRA
jgi:hypothetical protein